MLQNHPIVWLFQKNAVSFFENITLLTKKSLYLHENYKGETRMKEYDYE